VKVKRGDRFYSEYFKKHGTVVLFMHENFWFFILDDGYLDIQKAQSRPEALNWIYLQAENSRERRACMSKFKSYFNRIFRPSSKEEVLIGPKGANNKLQISSEGIKPEDNILLQIKEENGTIHLKIIRVGDTGVKLLDHSAPFPVSIYGSKIINIMGTSDIHAGDELNQSFDRLAGELEKHRGILKKYHQ
jgi:hypothetical protein